MADWGAADLLTKVIDLVTGKMKVDATLTGSITGVGADVDSSLKAVLVTLASKIAGEDQDNDLIVTENRYNYKNLAANATTTVKSTPGFLHSLVINTPGATGNTVTLYDNTAGSGTKIATIDATANVPTRIYNVQFATGLTVVIVNGTAADITITYR